MKQRKLFENVSGNQFRLITEGVVRSESTLVQEGLKKVFASADKEISYQRLQNIGVAYIRDISDAPRIAIREARELASQFGYEDDEANAKFVKKS